MLEDMKWSIVCEPDYISEKEHTQCVALEHGCMNIIHDPQFWSAFYYIKSNSTYSPSKQQRSEEWPLLKDLRHSLAQ